MDAEDETAVRNAGFWPALGGNRLWCREDARDNYQQLLLAKDGTWTAAVYAGEHCVKGMPTASAALMAAELMNWGRK